MAKRFEDFDIWQNAHQFVLVVYRTTSRLPADEKFGLASQFRRAAVSVPANIAEGYSRYSSIEKARFFNIAESSLDECRYYCILCRDLGYEAPDGWEVATQQLKSQLAAYIRALRSKDPKESSQD